MKKIALMIVGAGGLSLAALSPAPSEAAAVHLSAGFAPSADSNVAQVRHGCYRRWDGSWACRYYNPYPAYSYYDEPYYYRPRYRSYGYYGYYRPYYRSWWGGGY